MLLYCEHLGKITITLMSIIGMNVFKNMSPVSLVFLLHIQYYISFRQMNPNASEKPCFPFNTLMLFFSNLHRGE